MTSIIVDTPKEVVDILVTEILRNVGVSDWNEPENIVKSISQLLNYDNSKSIDDQDCIFKELERSMIFKKFDKKTNSYIPIWIFQSLIRVDDARGNLYIIYK